MTPTNSSPKSLIADPLLLLRRNSSVSVMSHLRRNSTIVSAQTDASSDVLESDTDPEHADSSDEEVEEEVLQERRTRAAMQSAKDSLRDVDLKTNPHVKLVNILKSPTTAKASLLIALNTFKSSDFTQARNQALFVAADGLDSLLHLLSESKDVKVRAEVLELLTKLSACPEFQVAIFDIQGLKGPLDMLVDDRTPPQLVAAVCDFIAIVSQFHGNRRTVRQLNGLQPMVSLLRPTARARRFPRLLPAASKAVSSLCMSAGNRHSVRAAGGLHTMGELVAASIRDGSSPESDETVRHLMFAFRLFVGATSNHAELLACDIMEITATVLSKATDIDALEHGLAILAPLSTLPEVQRAMHRAKAVKAVVRLLDKRRSVQGLALTTLQRLAEFGPNRKGMLEAKIAPTLTSLLKSDDEGLVAEAAQTMAAVAVQNEGRGAIKRAGAIPLLVGHLKGVHHQLLQHVAEALAALGQDPKAAQDIANADGIRLLWSLLKMKDNEVTSMAASALVPLLDSPKQAAMVGRTFVGGLDLIVRLFHLSPGSDEPVLGYAAAIVAQLAQDPENCQVLTESGVLHDVCRLVRSTRSDLIRGQAALALGRMAVSGNNRATIGSLGVLEPLVSFFTDSKDPKVHRATAMALSKLAGHPENARILREVGAHVPLVKLMGQADEDAQVASADAVRQIRQHHVKMLERG